MILITATGRDHPGMVAAIAQKLFDADCSIQDATMTRLSGEFAMILVVAPAAEISANSLTELLAPLRDSHGLQIHCNAFDASTPAPENTRFMLSVYGPDRSGLVARVAGVLAAHAVNITDLQTRVAGGRELYVMIFELELPPQLSPEVLQDALDAAARELGLEYSLHAIEEDAL